MKRRWDKSWIILLLLSGCGGDDTLYTLVEPTFSSIRSQILTRSCQSCHSAETAASLGEGNVLVTYSDVLNYVTSGNPNISLFYTQLNSGSMPKTGKLPQQNIDAVKTWIENGAQNN